MRETFLDALAAGWSFTHAAELAGRSRQRFYELAKDDPEFEAATRDAIEAGTEVLLDEARRRAVDGWEEPVYQGGDLVGQVRRYSDKMLELLISLRTGYRRGASVQINALDAHVQLDHPDATSLRETFELLRKQGALDESDVIDAEVEELPALPPGEAT